MVVCIRALASTAPVPDDKLTCRHTAEDAWGRQWDFFACNSDTSQSKPFIVQGSCLSPRQTGACPRLTGGQTPPRCRHRLFSAIVFLSLALVLILRPTVGDSRTLRVTCAQHFYWLRKKGSSVTANRYHSMKTCGLMEVFIGRHVDLAAGRWMEVRTPAVLPQGKRDR